MGGAALRLAFIERQPAPDGINKLFGEVKNEHQIMEGRGVGDDDHAG